MSVKIFAVFYLVSVWSGGVTARKRLDYKPNYFSYDDITTYIRDNAKKSSSNDPANEAFYNSIDFADELYSKMDTLMSPDLFMRFMAKPKMVGANSILNGKVNKVNGTCSIDSIFAYNGKNILKAWDEDRKSVIVEFSRWQNANEGTKPGEICNRFRGLVCQGGSDPPSCQCDGDPENVKFYTRHGYPDGCYVRPWKPCQFLSNADPESKIIYKEFHSQAENQRQFLAQLVFPLARTQRCAHGSYCVDLVPGLQQPICWCENSEDGDCALTTVPILTSNELISIRRNFVRLLIPPQDLAQKCTEEFNEDIVSLFNGAGLDPAVSESVTIMKNLVKARKKKSFKICDLREGFICVTNRCVQTLERSIPEEVTTIPQATPTKQPEVVPEDFKRSIPTDPETELPETSTFPPKPRVNCTDPDYKYKDECSCLEDPFLKQCSLVNCSPPGDLPECRLCDIYTTAPQCKGINCTNSTQALNEFCLAANCVSNPDLPECTNIDCFVAENKENPFCAICRKHGYLPQCISVDCFDHSNANNSQCGSVNCSSEAYRFHKTCPCYENPGGRNCPKCDVSPVPYSCPDCTTPPVDPKCCLINPRDQSCVVAAKSNFYRAHRPPEDKAIARAAAVELPLISRQLSSGDKKIDEECTYVDDKPGDCDIKSYLTCEKIPGSSRNVCRCIPGMGPDNNKICKLPLDSPCDHKVRESQPGAYINLPIPDCLYGTCTKINGHKFCRPLIDTGYPLFVPKNAAAQIKKKAEQGRSLNLEDDDDDDNEEAIARSIAENSKADGSWLNDRVRLKYFIAIAILLCVIL